MNFEFTQQYNCWFHFSSPFLYPLGSINCSSLQIKLPQSPVKGRRSERRGLPGKRASLSGKLHGHYRCHLRNVHESKRRAGLHGLTFEDKPGLEFQEWLIQGVTPVQFSKVLKKGCLGFCSIYYSDNALLDIVYVYLDLWIFLCLKLEEKYSWRCFVAGLIILSAARILWWLLLLIYLSYRCVPFISFIVLHTQKMLSKEHSFLDHRYQPLFS